MGASGGEPRVTVDQGVGTATSNSATVAAAGNAACVATLAAQAGKTNYLTGLILSVGVGAAVSNLLCTVTGIVGGPWDIVLAIGTTLSGVIDLSFIQPVPGAAVNTAITATIPATGGAGPVSAAVVTGYYE